MLYRAFTISEFMCFVPCYFLSSIYKKNHEYLIWKLMGSHEVSSKIFERHKSHRKETL